MASNFLLFESHTLSINCQYIHQSEARVQKVETLQKE